MPQVAAASGFLGQQPPRHVLAGSFRGEGGGAYPDTLSLAHVPKSIPQLTPSFGRVHPQRRSPSQLSSVSSGYPLPASGALPPPRVDRTPDSMRQARSRSTPPVLSYSSRPPSTRPPSEQLQASSPKSIGSKRSKRSKQSKPDQVRYHVPSGYYRDPRVLHGMMQPVLQGDAAEGEYMGNRKLNKRYDVKAGDHRGQASGSTAMKQDMMKGYGMVWEMGSNGLWSHNAAKSTVYIRPPSVKQNFAVKGGDYRGHIAAEKNAMEIKDAPRLGEHAVVQGDYRVHVNYDKYHPPVLKDNDTGKHRLAQGDYREHVQYDKYHSPSIEAKDVGEHRITQGDYRGHVEFDKYHASFTEQSKPPLGDASAASP